MGGKTVPKRMSGIPLMQPWFSCGNFLYLIDDGRIDMMPSDQACFSCFLHEPRFITSRTSTIIFDFSFLCLTYSSLFGYKNRLIAILLFEAKICLEKLSVLYVNWYCQENFALITRSLTGYQGKIALIMLIFVYYQGKFTLIIIVFGCYQGKCTW